MADLVFGVSPQVREEACEAVMAANYVGGSGNPKFRRLIRKDLEEAFPIIAEAAVKAERERIRSEIPRIKAEVNAAFDYPQAANIALGSVLAAIDKEGEQDAPEDR